MLLTCSFLKKDAYKFPRVKGHMLSQFQLRKLPTLIPIETLSKLEICALTLGNFGVFFQKRTCLNNTAPDYGLNENQVLGRLFVVQFKQHFYDNIKIDNRILYHVVVCGGNFFT